jgi:tetratricopeptide (TPR) repeat protein
LLSKEAAVVLPAVLLAADGLVLAARDGLGPAAAWRRAVRRSLPFWGLAAAFLLYRLPAALGIAGGKLTPATLWERLPGALETYARYLRVSLLPAFMEPFYPQQRPDSLLLLWPLLGAAGLALSVTLLCRWARRRPLAAFALAFFLVTVLPVVDLVPISVRRMGLTDRYLYLPSVGIALLLALGIAALLRGGPPRRRAGWAALLLVLAAYPTLTLAYAPVFTNSIALFARMERAVPRNPLPPFNLGLAYLEAGDQTRAAAALERSLALDPTRVRARATLGFLYVLHGRREEGFRLLDGLASLPDLDFTYYLNRTKAHLFVGEVPQALTAAAEGVRRFPARPDLQEWYGRTLGHAGRLDEAVAAYRTALRLAPDRFLVEEALGLVLARLGKVREALPHLERAAAGLPDRVAPRRALALLLAGEGQAAASARLWREVLQLSPDGATTREALTHLRRLAADGPPAPSSPVAGASQ